MSEFQLRRIKIFEIQMKLNRGFCPTIWREQDKTNYLGIFEFEYILYRAFEFKNIKLLYI